MRKRSSSFSELSIEEILDKEKVRYHRKGYGLIFASVIVVSWFIFLPQLLPYFWPSYIENPSNFAFIAGMVIHEGFFILINLSFFIIYKLEIDFFERYKTHDQPWPWKSNPEKWNKQIQRTFIFLAINHLVFMPLILLPYYIFNHCPFSLEYHKLPSCLEIITQTVSFMIMEDFCFYWSHRALHMEMIYPYIHKIHHEYINVVSISSEFSHPLEFIFGNVLTSNLGPLILGKRVHFSTFAMWIIMRIGETTDGHSGYEFSWSPYRLLPFSGSSEFHNFHHLNTKGNYSSFFTYWDRLLGTVNPSFEKFVQKKQELNDKQSTEKKKMK
jgi:sterol desaturase/sphingolipid hydroxylase (fatty acid hydroxylase superfamily)